jgi:hypothetical protein
VRLISSKKGNATLVGMLATLGVVLFTAVFSQLGTFRINLTQKRIQDSINQLNNETIGNILVFMVRESMIQYYKQLADFRTNDPNLCPSANTLEAALIGGHSCPSNSAVFRIFNNQTPDAGVLGNTYSLSGPGCELRTQSSNCVATDPVKIMDIGFTDPNITLSDYKYEVYFVTSKPLLGVLEFIVIKTHKANPNQKSRSLISIQTNSNSLAHVVGDGSIVIQNPNLTSRCESTPWGQFLKLNSNSICLPYDKSGSVTGLSVFDYFGARLFGHQNTDGRVVVLGELEKYSTTPKRVNQVSGGSSGGISIGSAQPVSRFIDSTGKNSLGEQVFVPYETDALLGADDFEVVKGGELENDLIGQLYYIKGSGPGASLFVYNPYSNVPTQRHNKICNFADLGYPVSFHSLIALSWSEVLALPNSPIFTAQEYVARRRSAYFLLADATGRMLFAAVIQEPSTISESGNITESTTRCVVADLKQGLRDTNTGELKSGVVEYLRTYGATPALKPKPYKIEKL